jgi:hypothetical protein
MKKILFTIIILVLFVHCETTKYDGEEKLRLLAEFQDQEGNLIEDIQVKVINQFADINENIATGRSDDRGFLSLVFPGLEKFNVIYSIQINDPKGVFADLTIKNIEKQDFSNLQLDLNTVALVPNNQLTTFVIDRNAMNPSRYLRNISIDGQLYFERVDYQNNFDNFDIDHPIYKVFKNQTITLNYLIEDRTTQNTVIEEYSIEININNESVIYYTIDI